MELGLEPKLISVWYEDFVVSRGHSILQARFLNLDELHA